MSGRGPPTPDTGGLERLRAAIAAGAVVDDPATLGLAPQVARRLSLAWRLGAPLLPELDRAIADVAADAEVSAEVRVATAEARAVATGLLLAPVVLVPGLGRLLAVDLLGFYASGTGRTVALVAVGLHGAGAIWVRGAVARAGRPPRDSGTWRPGVLAVAAVLSLVVHPLVGVGCAVVAGRGRAAQVPDEPELVALAAVAVRAGLDPVGALRAAATALPTPTADRAVTLALRLELGGGDGDGGTASRLARTLTAALEHGAPVGPSLDRLAEELRRERRVQLREAVARLPARLTVPTTLLILPGSLLAVGAPLVAEALRGAT